MADSAAMWFRLALLLGLILPAPVMAQTWTACIDPRTGGLTTEGFRAVREAAEASTDEPRGQLSYTIRRSSTSGKEPPQAQTVFLEMEYAGISSSWLRWDSGIPYTGLPLEALDCFEIKAGHEPPLLPHFYGPYFPVGSVVIPEHWRPTMRFLLPGYQPGRTIFRVHGYADTSGTIEQNERLSAARAQAVARELVRLGVRWDDIEQHSFGESHLARPTADGVAEPLNRRAWIDVRLRPEPAR